MRQWLARCILILCVVTASVSAARFASAQPAPVNDAPVTLRGAFHVHTDFSCGLHSPDDTVRLARQAGLDFLIFADHDAVTVEYGLFPLQRIIRREKSKPFVFARGDELYFDTLRQAQRDHPDIVLIPGLELNAHYSWTGNPIQGLTLRNLTKHVVVFGMPDWRDYRALPTMHNPHAYGFQSARLPAFLLALLPLAAAVALRRRMRPRWRWPVILGCALAAFSQHPFANSPYSPYADFGEAPYQAVIDAARAKGALTVWAHPEGRNPLDGQLVEGVEFASLPYPEAVRDTHGAAGVAVLYAEAGTTLEKAGGIWDEILLDYVQGRRDDAPFGYGELDYNGSSCSDFSLVQTIVRAREKSEAAILEALRDGRMSAAISGQGIVPVLAFSLWNESGLATEAGGAAAAASAPELRVQLDTVDSATDAVAPTAMRVWIYKNGARVHEATGTTPLTLAWTDPDFDGAPAYYRVEAGGPHGMRTLSNPIFCNRR